APRKTEIGASATMGRPRRGSIRQEFHVRHKFENRAANILNSGLGRSEKASRSKVVFGRMVSTVVFSPVASAILGLSVLLSFSFFIYGINTLHLTRRARGYSQPSQNGMTSRPAVAVHLPVYNELYVADRLLNACVRMAEHYGRSLVRVCVIDDSDDETREKLDALARSYNAQGYRVEILRRETRAGFKAGALQA